MRDSLWYKRIPTLFGLILLAVGIFTLTYAVNNGVFFLTKASPTYAPENIRITNLTDTSFTISYTTAEPVLGSLSYGKTPTGGSVALDDRDQQSGNPKPYYIHHITLNNLEPNTRYYYTILSAGKSFLDEDKPFTITTLITLTQDPTTQQPIVGSVTSSDGSNANNIIVYLVTDNAQTLSVLAKDNGSFVMPLNALRTKDYTSYLSFKDTSIIKLLAQSSTEKATVSVLASQINPVPPIILGNSYDFTTSLQVTPVPIASGSADVSAFPSFSATEAGPQKPSIINPASQEELSDQQPQFEGTALPNTPVEIEIHSTDPIKTTVTANKNGSWSYRPTTKLAPGEHTITIKTKDNDGILQTITKSFIVYAEGSQFTEPSVAPSLITPSPTLSPVSPTPSPLPTISVAPTASPTATPVLTATPTPTPLLVTGILTQSAPPVEESPGSSFVIISGIIGAITLSLGALFLLTGKGNTL